MRRRPPRDPSRLLARLRRRGEVRALCRVVSELGVEAWLVGGAVRDALLGMADSEIDVALSGDVEAVARALESAGAGRAVFLSRDRPGPRVYRVAGRRPLDLAEVEGGSIETDLRRRDFTVNAVAVSLGDGRVLDPYGGIADLGRGRLRPVRPSNLLDDPLRAVRAARLMATRGLLPDRETLAAARAAAPRLRAVAAERVGAELSRILGSPRCAPAVSWASRAGILAPTLGLPLDPATGRRVRQAVRALDDPATARLPEARRRSLRLAAIAAGLGLDGSATRAWLSRRRLPRRESEDAGRLVELLRRPRPEGGREAWRWIIAAGPLAEDGLHLLARVGGPRRPGSLTRLRRFARAKRRRVAVSGVDVMRWLEIPPGPRVGALLAELQVAAACGEVKNRREARHWLSGQVRDRRAAAIIAAH